MIRRNKPPVMARYSHPRPEKRRRIPFILLAAGLLAFAAVQVGALWKHSPGAALSSAQDNRLQEKVASELAGRDAEIMQKVVSRLQADPSDLEAELLKGLLYFKAGYRDRALAVMEDLTRRAPKFHLAHLILGDLLLVQVSRADDLGNNGVLRALAGGNLEQLDRLRSEASARLQGYLTMIDGPNVPAGLMLLDPGVRHAMVVDKSQHRLYVYENVPDAPPRLVANYYCVIGKIPGNKVVRGDQRTPEGVYFLHQRIPDEKLPDRYGMEAYPLNYPNEYDGRLGKTGDGIWLHGTDKDFYSRPPLDSDGCVVLANDDLERVARFIQPGLTPMIIADRVQWITRDQWRQRRQELTAQIESWRRDWESCRVDDYLRHYARDFYGDGCDITRWQERKRRVAQGKTYQRIALSGLNILSYPPAASSGREMVVASFRQDYRSNNLNSDMIKRLYLVREGSQWKIWYEGGREQGS